jgi:hypothetical protein
MAKSILVNSRYSPARGGHAPSDVREAFLTGIEQYVLWGDGEPEPIIELREQQVPLSTLCGLLWNCSDTVPRLDLDSLVGDCNTDIKGGTYACVARWMKPEIQRQVAKEAALIAA